MPLEIADLPFIIPDPNNPNDTTAIQNAVNSLSPTNKGVVYLRGRKWYISGPITLPRNCDIMIEGYGAQIILTGTGYPAFVSNVTSRAEANQAILYKIIIKGLTIIGQGDFNSVGIDIRGTYGSKIESCHFINLGTGVIGTFCLNTVIDDCFITSCRKEGFVLRSGVDIWSDASSSDSQSNCSIIKNCRVYGFANMFSHYKFLSSSECRLIDSISEGSNPVNCIVFNTQSHPNFGYEQILITSRLTSDPDYVYPNSGSITIAGETSGPFTNITPSTDLTSIANALRTLPKCVAGVYEVKMYGTNTIIIQAPTLNINTLSGGVVLVSNNAFRSRSIPINGGSGYLAPTVTNFVADNIHIECSPTDAVYRLTSYGLMTIARNYYVFNSIFIYGVDGSELMILVEHNYWVWYYYFKCPSNIIKFKGYGNSLGSVAGLTHPSRYEGAPPYYRTYDEDQMMGKFFDVLYAMELFILAKELSIAPGAFLVSYTPPTVKTAANRGVQVSFAPEYLKHIAAPPGSGYDRPIPTLKSLSQNEDARDSILLAASNGQNVRLWFSINAGVATPHYDIV